MNDNIKKLEKLLEWVAAFNAGVQARFEGDNDLRDKAANSLQSEEMEELQELAKQLIAEGMDTLDGSVSEEALKINLKVIDVTTGLATRVISEDGMLEYLPEDMKSQDIADQLRAEGAEHVAKVVEYALKSA